MSEFLLGKNSEEILNKRIEEEEKSSRLYQAMSLWLENSGYTGAAKAWKKDAEDEMGHAQWAKDFLLDMGITPTLRTINEPQHEFNGLPDIIQKTYDHEILITQQCNELANFAYLNGNHLLYQLAMKYLTEQQEEVSRSITMMDKLKAFGDSQVALKLFDNELGED